MIRRAKTSISEQYDDGLLVAAAQQRLCIRGLCCFCDTSNGMTDKRSMAAVTEPLTVAVTAPLTVAVTAPLTVAVTEPLTVAVKMAVMCSVGNETFYCDFLYYSMQSVQNAGLAAISQASGSLVDSKGYLILITFYLVGAPIFCDPVYYCCVCEERHCTVLSL